MGQGRTERSPPSGNSRIGISTTQIYTHKHIYIYTYSGSGSRTHDADAAVSLVDSLVGWLGVGIGVGVEESRKK